MKFFCFSIIILLLGLYGCNSEIPTNKEFAESRITDSFIVNGIRSRYELKDMHAWNDSTLLTYSHETNEVSTYVKKKNTREYYFRTAKRLPVDALPFAFILNPDGSFTIFDETRNIYQIDSALRLVKKTPIPIETPLLKNNYILLKVKVNPLLQLGDTFILRYRTETLEHAAEDLKEHCLMEFVYKEGSFSHARYYFQKPDALKNFEMSVSFWTYRDEYISVIYPYIDSVYSFNRRTRTYDTRPIHNQNFKTPEDFDHAMRSKPEYNSYELKYTLRNFEYIDFYYNENTDHYIFTYSLPVADTFKLRKPVEKDKEIRTLVLDKDFRFVNDYGYHRTYWPPFLTAYISGKGNVAALFEDVNDFRRMKFYVFNF